MPKEISIAFLNKLNDARDTPKKNRLCCELLKQKFQS